MPTWTNSKIEDLLSFCEKKEALWKVNYKYLNDAKSVPRSSFCKAYHGTHPSGPLGNPFSNTCGFLLLSLSGIMSFNISNDHWRTSCWLKHCYLAVGHHFAQCVKKNPESTNFIVEQGGIAWNRSYRVYLKSLAIEFHSTTHTKPISCNSCTVCTGPGVGPVHTVLYLEPCSRGKTLLSG